MAIQKPYSITPSNGQAIPAEESNLINWKVSGAVQTKYSVFVWFNNFTDIKLSSHGLATGDLIINTTRDSTYTGVRSVTVVDVDHISVSEIKNMTVGDSIDKFVEDTTIDSTASSTSTDTVIELTETGTIAAGDVVYVDGEYRLVSSVTTDTSITVGTAFSTSTASKTVKAWHKSGTQSTEYHFKNENVSSYDTEYTLASNSIFNGKEFKLKITVFDENSNSATSDPVIFQSSSRPTATIDPIGTSGTVGHSSYNFTGDYSQSENVSLSNYIFYLYNADKVKISDSDILTDKPIDHLFSDLQSGNVYYVELQVTSDKALTGSSGLIKFDVSYSSPDVTTSLTAENTKDAGIKLTLDVIQIIGTTTGTTSFDANDTKLDVTQGTVYFDDGFTVDNTFTLQAWIETPENKTDLIILKGANGYLKLQYHWIDEKFHLYKLIDNNIVGHWISDAVSGTKYYIYIQQINNNCNIHAEVLV